MHAEGKRRGMALLACSRHGPLLARVNPWWTVSARLVAHSGWDLDGPFRVFDIPNCVYEFNPDPCATYF